MNELIQALKISIPQAVEDFNTVRLPMIEKSWGRSFKQEMLNENQVTVEIAKNFARPLNNCIFRYTNAILPQFTEHTTDGSDYVYGDILIEDKNSFSADSNGWVGNGFKKTPIHLLKKFKCDSNGRIISLFAAIVDLSTCSSQWSDKKIDTNRSVISFEVSDYNKISIIHGNLKLNKKYIKPILIDIKDIAWQTENLQTFL